MSGEPDWLKQARENGLVTGEGVGVGVNLAALTAAGSAVGHRTDPAAGRETEAAFQQRVIDLLHERGFTVAHFRTIRILRADGSSYYATPVQADGEGFLDLEAVRPPRVLKIELKVGYNKPSAKQHGWIGLYEQCPGVEVYCWWPEDWSTILEVTR